MIGILIVIGSIAHSLNNNASALEDIANIRVSRNAKYCESCTGGRLNVAAHLTMKIEKKNLANEGEYFPVSDISGITSNFLEWREETWRSGLRYREHLMLAVPNNFKGPSPSTFDITIWHNGTHSWKYRPIDRAAEKIKGIDRSTQIVQDYYGDMIGSKIPGDAGMWRLTLEGQDHFIYDVDELLAGNSCKVVGEERIGSEDCVIIERPDSDRIWLATNKNFVVFKREIKWSPNGPLKRRILNNDFRRIESGIWLPFACKMEIYSHPSTPPERRVGILTASVERATVVFPDSDFEPSFPKGTRVFDEETRFTSIAGYTDKEVEVMESKRTLEKLKSRKSADELAFKAEPFWKRYLAGEVVIISLVTLLVIFRLVARKSK